ncbi:MAG TPA: SMP-30/gluconolactonase/LRE family protein [Nevskiaceae bacterium]|nr:SMP-30/gluconolactonase/LRE family protein [Nevskiaceae bacterium]
MREPVKTLAEGFSFLEGPRWHDGRLWASDFYTHRVVAIDAAGRVETMARVPAQPSGLGFLPDGDALIVSMRDRRLLRRGADGNLRTHADLHALAPWHLNDMVVDGRGNAYVGNFGFDLMGGAPQQATHLILVTPDGDARVVAGGLMFPNGMVITPDGKTLVVAESLGPRLTAFAIGPQGELGPGRTWADLGRPASGQGGSIRGTIVPDGICLDAEGAIWVADAEHPRAVRIAEGGARLEEVTTEGIGVYACTLGGDDGRTLFLCAAPSYREHERAHTRDARVLTTRVGAWRAGWP